MKVEIGCLNKERKEDLKLIPENEDEISLLKKFWFNKFFHVHQYKEATGEICIMSERGIGIMRNDE